MILLISCWNQKMLLRITSDEQFYPDAELLGKLEVYENLGPKYIGIYNDLFLELKMYRK